MTLSVIKIDAATDHKMLVMDKISHVQFCHQFTWIKVELFLYALVMLVLFICSMADKLRLEAIFREWCMTVTKDKADHPNIQQPPLMLKCTNKFLPRHAAFCHETSNVMQMNNHQFSDWSHYTDYKTWRFTINPQSAYIKKKKRWSHYCTASVYTPTL